MTGVAGSSSGRRGDPRLAPLSPDQWDDETARLLGTVKIGDGEVLNLFPTVARHPGVLRRFLAFSDSLLFGGVLPARLRELAILRVAWNTQSAFEWGHHVRIAASVGIPRGEAERVALSIDSVGWSDVERAVLVAADELHADAGLSDDTWALLREHLDDAQLVEIPLVIGNYTMIAYLLNALLVENDSGIELPTTRASS